MYLRILKKDLKRKKTMNVILLIFIILAAMFIASSGNNIMTVSTALDSYFEKAEIPDYWFTTVDSQSLETFEDFADKNQYNYRCLELIQIDPKKITVDGRDFEYSNTSCISSLKNSTKVFDENDREITEVHDGEIYVTSGLFYTEKNGFKVGDSIEITANGKTKTFTLKGSTKDAAFGSDMIGMTRLLISENDYAYFKSAVPSIMYSMFVYTDDPDYLNQFDNLELNTIFSVNGSTIKNIYIMDMITAVVMLIVSVCLILISMVILHFTINFTMSEEFREIGVMKAIGIPNRKIRELYIIKYFAISLVGVVVGLVLSVPFGNMMIQKFSQNIIMSNSRLFLLNIVCAFSVAAVVVLFCYFCTRKIKKFSPIDAIRNGENGERYSRKGIIRLNKSHLAPIPFLALNDIFSGLKRFATMIVIFALGLLLIIVPMNTIQTLQSDNLICWFSVAKCDHIISEEMLLTAIDGNKTKLEERLNEVKQKLSEHQISAEVFQEAVFRFNISHGNRKTSSISFQGNGDVTAKQYVYLEGTAPQRTGEIAVTRQISERIGAAIGDDVTIKIGEQTKTFIVTALYQSMNNMGEGIRFYQDETLDYHCIFGSFGIQIKYTDNPDSQTLAERKDLLEKLYPDGEIYTAGEYVNYMIGEGTVETLQDIERMIWIVVLCVNILVTVLMVKSFITKEKGEIAMLKAVGFQNKSLIAWQTLRIGIVLLFSILIASLFSTPLTKLTIEPIFKIMGAESIEFAIQPLKTCFLYPLIVLGVTVFSGFVAALQVRSISASETSNIE